MPTDLPDWVPQRRRAIGNRIRDLRLERNLTQEALAERAGLDRKTVNRIETGTVSARLDQLLLIASGLRVHITDLFIGP